jgi:hypothetical protein
MILPVAVRLLYTIAELPPASIKSIFISHLAGTNDDDGVIHCYVTAIS